MSRTDQQEVFVTLRTFLTERQGDRVALGVVYGSFPAGRSGPRSDVDMYYVPVRPGDPVANVQAIVADVAYDLFCLDWDRLERIAEFRDPLTPLLLDGLVVHHRTSDDLARMMELKARAREHLVDADFMAQRADERLTAAARGLAGVPRPAVLADVRLKSPAVLSDLLTATAYPHGTYPKRGLQHLVTTLGSCDWVPDDVAEPVTRAVLAATVAEAPDALHEAFHAVDLLASPSDNTVGHPQPGGHPAGVP